MKKGLTKRESKRKIFTSAEKSKVDLSAVKGIKTINEIAQEYRVHPTQVSQWKNTLKKSYTVIGLLINTDLTHYHYFKHRLIYETRHL